MAKTFFSYRHILNVLTLVFKTLRIIVKETIFFGLHSGTEPIRSYQQRVRMLHSKVPYVLISFPRSSTSTLMLMMECNDAVMGFFPVQQQH